MLLKDFYDSVLPSSGHLALFDLKSKAHQWAVNTKELARLTELKHGAQGVYFATASFVAPTKRTQDNVALLRSLRLDVDAGVAKNTSNPQGSYPTQREALAATVGFAQATSLLPSHIVSSGEGLHVYFALAEDVSPAAWAPLAARLAALCVEHGFKADPTVTRDTARVLRPIGSLHKNGSRVTLLKSTGKVYTVDELTSLLGVAPPAEDDFAFAAGRTFGASVINDDVVQSIEGPPKSVIKIVENCAAMREAAHAKGDIPEPFWRAMLGIVKFTVEGLDMAHEMSSGHPDYDPAETEKKFNAYAAGPTSCSQFSQHTEACVTCPHAGKIKSPIVLGYMTDPEVAELPVELQPQEPAPVAAPGMPWDGCMPARYQIIGAPGAYTLQATMKVTKEDDNGAPVTSNVIVPVTHDIFWLGQWAEAADSKDTAQVTVHTWAKGLKRTFLMDQSLAASSAELLKWLAGKAIHLTTDKKAVTAVTDYVKLQLQRIKNMAQRPKIAERFGLRIDDRGALICAHGNHVIFPDGSIQESMLSEQLRQIASHYPLPLPASDNGEWTIDVWDGHIKPLARRYTEFMTKYYGVPGLEKYQLAAMLGLCSPFMAFVTGGYSHGIELPPNGLSVSLYSRESGQGKTALVHAIMLAFGNPDALVKESNKGGATDIGRMARLSTSGTFPTSMEEMGGTKEISITDMISAVANGGGRTRGTKEGGFTTAQSWALINLITTNRAQRDMVNVGQKESPAIQLRLLELNVDDVRFTRDGRADHGAAWALVKDDTKGALGAFIHYSACKIGFEKLNKMLLACVKEADGLLQGDQGARFQYRALGALLFLQAILEQQGMAMFKRETLIDQFKQAYDAGMQYVAENVLPTDGVSLMGMMLSDLRGQTIVTDNETHRGHNRLQYDVALNSRISDKVVARHIVSAGLTYLSTQAVRDWCTDNKVAEREMVHECKKAGILLVPNPAYQGRYTGQYDLYKGMREASAAQTSCYKISIRVLLAQGGGGWDVANDAGAKVVGIGSRQGGAETDEIEGDANSATGVP